MSMDDVLNDTPPTPAPEPPSSPEPVSEPQAPAPSTPAPTPAAPEPPAQKPEEPKQDMTPEARAFYLKAQDEKRKRQELERELEQLRKPKEEKPKEFWEDPEGKIKSFEDQMRKIAEQTRLNVSEQIVRSKHEDFDEKVDIFKSVLDRAPWLWEEARKSPNPAEFVYKTAKNYQELQQAGDLDTVKKNMEQELRVKLEAEFKAKEEAKRKELEGIPKSLSDVRNTGSNKPVWNGPESLDLILKG